MKLPLCYFILCLSFSGFSQVDDREYSAWNMILPQKTINEKWNVQSEFHRRSRSFYTDINQWLIRPQVNYNISEKTTFGVGYSYLNNQNQNPQLDNVEHNVYQNLQFRQKTKLVNFTHQIRFEERFMDSFEVVNGNVIQLDDEFAIRTRVRMTGVAPLATLGDNSSISLVAFNEFFMNMSDTFRPDSFDQNWLFIAPQVKINEHIAVTTGYQDVYQKRGEGFVGNSIWSSVMNINF